MSPSVAKFHAEVGETPAEGHSSEIQAISGNSETGGKIGLSLPFDGWIKKQEKKRWVAVAPTSYPQRTATPTVRAFSECISRFLQGGLLEAKR